jgi:calcineurin-like phosphoesterase family protein
MSYFFTADEHYGHTNIIKYQNRPFKTVEEMDNILIVRHNEVVKEDDIVIHAGDFTMRYKNSFSERLNGTHIFLRGSHDYWMDKELAGPYADIWEQEIEGQHIVVCHYAMRVWSKSHYNSWQLFGHSHGKLEGIGKQMDIGVDTNNFYPYSFADIKKIMSKKEDNFNLIK